MTESLRFVAERTDATITAARSELVRAVRRAYASGMTQAQIAEQIHRSQPEVNRLLRLHGTSPRATALRAHAAEIRRSLRDVGGSRICVFGSTATGTEHADSDVDLLFDMRRPLSLMELSTVERQLTELIGFRVDLVPESSVRPDVRDRIVAEAVPL